MAFVTPKNIPKLIMALPILGILFTTILIGIVTIYSIDSNFEKEKEKITKQFFDNLQQTTKQRVNLTYNIIDSLYQNTKDYNKTIKLMQKVLSKMRWDKKGYIFVFDYKGNTLYHPNHYYMTINRWNFERNGVKVIRLLIQSALKHPSGTYVKYLAYNPDGSPKEKVSFVKVYKPLKIVIGNGVYLNYLDKKLLRQQQNIENLLKDILIKLSITSLVILFIMIIIVYFFSYKLRKLFKKYDKEIHEEKHQLFLRANFDILTKLHNREHFLFELKEHLLMMQRDFSKLAILFIDLDHFKEINDTLGHNSGDIVLKITADRLKHSVRASDVIARFGGDEFVILLHNIKHIDEIIELAQRILTKLKEPIVLDNHKYYVSSSIGISMAPDDSIDAETLIKYADIAMYKAKKSGKDRLTFYQSDMSDEAKKRISLKNDIHQALTNNEFELYYQPQIDKNEKLIGMEVLIRWNHPTKGVISPIEFIPLAIEVAIIDKIDLWVIENSIIQYKQWKKEGFNPRVISCNITMYQIEKNNFIKDLKDILDKYSFEAENLNLELTENSIMKNPKKSIQILNNLTKLGIKINIDDFGTGYSSLAYLKKFPVSKLKIDRSFIQDIPDDKDDDVITKTIIDLAKNLNLEIIAEGVETEVQKRFLLDYADLYIQGYLYSKPIKANEFKEKFLKGNKW